MSFVSSEYKIVTLPTMEGRGGRPVMEMDEIIEAARDAPKRRRLKNIRRAVDRMDPDVARRIGNKEFLLREAYRKDLSRLHPSVFKPIHRVAHRTFPAMPRDRVTVDITNDKGEVFSVSFEPGKPVSFSRDVRLFSVIGVPQGGYDDGYAQIYLYDKDIVCVRGPVFLCITDKGMIKRTIRVRYPIGFVIRGKDDSLIFGPHSRKYSAPGYSMYLQSYGKGEQLLDIEMDWGGSYRYVLSPFVEQRTGLVEFSGHQVKWREQSQGSTTTEATCDLFAEELRGIEEEVNVHTDLARVILGYLVPYF